MRVRGWLDSEYHHECCSCGHMTSGATFAESEQRMRAHDCDATEQEKRSL